MLDETGLWRDVVEMPSTLRATLEEDVEELAALVGADGGVVGAALLAADARR